MIGFDFVSHHPKVARQVDGGRTGTFVQVLLRLFVSMYDYHCEYVCLYACVLV